MSWVTTESQSFHYSLPHLSSRFFVTCKCDKHEFLGFFFEYHHYSRSFISNDTSGKETKFFCGLECDVEMFSPFTMKRYNSFFTLKKMFRRVATLDLRGLVMDFNGRSVMNGRFGKDGRGRFYFAKSIPR